MGLKLCRVLRLKKVTASLTLAVEQERRYIRSPARERGGGGALTLIWAGVQQHAFYKDSL